MQTNQESEKVSSKRTKSETANASQSDEDESIGEITENMVLAAEDAMQKFKKCLGAQVCVLDKMFVNSLKTHYFVLSESCIIQMKVRHCSEISPENFGAAEHFYVNQLLAEDAKKLE